MILATDDKGGIGKEWKLPWHLPSDLKFFKEITTTTLSSKKKNLVVMWRKTWDSLPEKVKPLPWRENIILSKDPNYKAPEGVKAYNDISLIIKEYSERQDIETLFIIWGASIYADALKREIVDKIYLTKIIGDFNCDTFFTWVPGNYKLEGMSDTLQDNGIMYQWHTYERIAPKIAFKPAMLEKKVINQMQ